MLDTIKKQNMIIEKLKNCGFEVLSVSYTGRHEITAKKDYIEISICTEECVCHGGRLWINSDHINGYHKELSHPYYDKELGITDSSTELEFIINNELETSLNELGSFVYKVARINEYGKKNGLDDEKVRYFNNISDATNYAIEGFNNALGDYNTITSFRYNCPNPKMYCITQKIKKQSKDFSLPWYVKYRTYFETTLYEENKNGEFEARKTFETYVEVFDKK